MAEYPYSAYHYFLEKQIPECLKNAWIVQNHGSDREAIEEMLNSDVDSAVLQELKTASLIRRSRK